MNAVQKLTRLNSLECTCEKNVSKNKCFTVCDICSEKKFLKKQSTPILTSSFED